MKFKVCWSASSNVSFRGKTDLDVGAYLDDDEMKSATLDDVERAVGDDVIGIALEASGFECWIEEVED